jgi:hypothetical protein
MNRKQSPASRRDSSIQKFLSEKFEVASKQPPSSANIDKLEAAEREAVNNLFSTPNYGFREVVLTCLTAWEEGIKFDPRKSFYKCNPRSVFEKGIRPVLQAYGIPHRSSGPLNVAKNQNALDFKWAEGRKPESAARGAVVLLNWILSSSKSFQDRKNLLLKIFIERLFQEKERLVSYSATARTDLTIHQTHRLVSNFISQAPDAGNTPQAIIGLLLFEIYRGSEFKVNYEGRACETNLTAKKPADSWVEDSDGRIICLYEITVKKIDSNRINDSHSSVCAHGKGHTEVVWLCRLAEDVKEITLSSDFTYEYNGIRNEFLDINNWILIALQLVGADGRANFLTALSGYVNSPSTNEKTKIIWNQLVAA